MANHDENKLILPCHLSCLNQEYRLHLYSLVPHQIQTLYIYIYISLFFSTTKNVHLNLIQFVS